MKNMKFRIYSFSAGLCYLLFWWLYLLLLPIRELKYNYAYLINSQYWFIINIIQVIALLSFVMFYLELNKQLFKDRPIDNIMEIMQVLSLLIFGAVAFYETFLWPIFVKLVPNSLNIINGEVFTNNLLTTVLIIGGLSMMITNIYIGIKLKMVFNTFGLFYSIGFSLFCLGFMINPIRYILQTIGLTLFCICFLYFSISKKNLTTSST